MLHGSKMRFREHDEELQGSTLLPRAFEKIHDQYRKRCACCYLKFITESNAWGLPWRGYATQDDEIWVCDQCFSLYAGELELHVGKNGNKH